MTRVVGILEKSTTTLRECENGHINGHAEFAQDIYHSERLSQLMTMDHPN